MVCIFVHFSKPRKAQSVGKNKAISWPPNIKWKSKIRIDIRLFPSLTEKATKKKWTNTKINTA